jgi:hypothetical protein
MKLFQTQLKFDVKPFWICKNVNMVYGATNQHLLCHLLPPNGLIPQQPNI